VRQTSQSESLNRAQKEEEEDLNGWEGKGGIPSDWSQYNVFGWEFGQLKFLFFNNSLEFSKKLFFKSYQDLGCCSMGEGG
jgi:uncharacterized membrane protein (UPF0182 family)